MKTRRSSRFLTLFSILLLMSVIIAGCGGAPAPAAPGTSSGGTSASAPTTSSSGGEQSGQDQPAAANKPDLKGQTGKLVVWLGNYAATPTVQAAAPEALKPTASAELIAEFEAMYPGVEIEVIDQPNPGWNEWQTYLATNGAAGTLPDVIYTMPQFATQDASKGWYLELTADLKTPNEFVGGNSPWLDQFVLQNTMSTPDGRLWNTPLGLSGVGVYYNKNLLSQLGYSAPPATLAEWIAMMDKGQANGFQDKVLLPNSYNWIRDTIEEQFAYAVREQMDMNKDGTRDVADIMAAYKSGIWGFGAPGYAEYLKLLKQLSAYQYKGEVPDQTSEFIKGEVPFMIDGVWNASRIQSDPNRKFEWGSFYFPKVTAESSPLVGAVDPFGIGGPTGFTLAVAASAQQKNVDRIAVAFLKWLSVPANIERMMGEVKLEVPNIQGTSGDPLLAPFYEQVKKRPEFPEATISGVAGVPNPRWGNEAQSQIDQLQAAYLTDEITLEEFIAEAKIWQDQGIDEVIKTNDLTDAVQSRIGAAGQ